MLHTDVRLIILGFLVNMENPPPEYGQVYENLRLETPPWPENVNILIIPGK